MRSGQCPSKSAHCPSKRAHCRLKSTLPVLANFSRLGDEREARGARRSRDRFNRPVGRAFGDEREARGVSVPGPHEDRIADANSIGRQVIPPLQRVDGNVILRRKRSERIPSLDAMILRRPRQLRRLLLLLDDLGGRSPRRTLPARDASHELLGGLAISR